MCFVVNVVNVTKQKTQTISLQIYPFSPFLFAMSKNCLQINCLFFSRRETKENRKRKKIDTQEGVRY